MVKRPSCSSSPQISPKRQKTANDQLESVKTFFRELIAQRHRDSALARREELWSEVVEKFAQLVRLLSISCGDEEDEIIDFQLVGSALELSTEFYAAELDSLSNDVYKLTATLNRTEKKSSRRKSGTIKGNLNCIQLSIDIHRRRLLSVFSRNSIDCSARHHAHPTDQSISTATSSSHHQKDQDHRYARLVESEAPDQSTLIANLPQTQLECR